MMTMINIYERILILFVVFALCISCMAVPALASEVTYTELLEYETVNGSGRNYFDMQSSGETNYYLLPVSGLVYHVELILYSREVITSVEISRNNGSGTFNQASVVSLGNNMYKVTYDPRQVFYGVYFKLYYATGGTNNVQVYSCRVWNVSVNTFAVPIVGNVTDGTGVTHTFTGYAGGNLQSNDIDLGNGASGTKQFSAQFTIGGQNFDFLCLGLAGRFANINSIACYCDGQTVPITYSFINNAYVTSHQQVITLSLDLTSLDPEVLTQYGLTLVLKGMYQDGDGGSDYLRFLYSTGHLQVAELNPIVYLFNQLHTWIDNGFQSIVDALGGGHNADDFNQGVQDAYDKMEDSSNAMNDFSRPDVDTVVPTIDIEYDDSVTDMLGTLFEDEFIGTITLSSLGIWLICIILGI